MASQDQDSSAAAGKVVNHDEANVNNVDDADSADSADSTAKIVAVGMDCAHKDLYQKFDAQNNPTWTDKMPSDLEEAAENEATERFAILVRNKKSYDPRKMLEIDSIVVQSPLLKKVLRTVLADYPGVTTSLQRLVFAAPFQPFVHRWPALQAALANADGKYDAVTCQHIRLLHDLLHAELKDVLAAVADYTTNGVVTYEHAWAVFHPGTTILTSRYGQPVAYRLKVGRYTEHQCFGPCLELYAERLEYDGNRFGYANAHVFVQRYVGTRPIVELDAYPLAHHPDPAAVRAALIERGRRFAALAGWHYQSYKGFAIETKDDGPVRVSVDGRIVIDALMHMRYNEKTALYLTPLQRAQKTRRVQVQNEDDDGYDSPYRCGDDPDDDQEAPATRMELRLVDGQYYNSYANPLMDGKDVFGFKTGGGGGGDGSTEDENEQKNADARRQAAALTDDELLLATSVVKGFALRSKKWLEFIVDDVRPVTFNAESFDRLVLPATHKQLVLAFTQSQVKNRHRFDDVIAGKGKGIIMLLSGGPGTGKTLTAESVAEAMQVPLYVLSGGDLGMASYEIERNLETTLEIVSKWNAVLLIDECDVFLEARSTSNLDRNRIVSVFLRMLEYYEGILFLTTNRVSNIDEAFHSRIHISLQYPSLDAAARRQVWAGFLGDNGTMGHGAEEAPAVASKSAAAHSSSHAVTPAELDRLAQVDLNGRQIKNIIKSGHLLAFTTGKILAMEHLQTVLRILGHDV